MLTARDPPVLKRVRTAPDPDREGVQHLEKTHAARFAGLETARGLILAVSGGPDSMALLLMAAAWLETRGLDAPPAAVVTVNHGLRPEAGAEAALVAQTACHLGLPHATLTWDGPKPSTRLQERARAVRYALLAEHARALGASHILTAHHADDQAETVLLRLGRGSGIAGLAGMRRCTTLGSDLTVARPLLGMTKGELMAICRAARCRYVDDPSNRDPAYARPRLRAQTQALAALGLDTGSLIRLARRMARADAALEKETDRVEDALAPSHGQNLYRADLKAARDLAPEIALRLLGRAVAHVAGTDAGTPPIRLERLEALAERLWDALNRRDAHHATLAGTRVVLDRDQVLTICKEPSRRRGRATTLRPN